MTIVWCMTHEIWSVTDIICCHSGLFFALLPLMKIQSFHKHKWQLYDVWFLRYGAWRTEFFVILDCFLPFYIPNNPKNQNFEKMKKPPWNIITLHMCTINDNHMMYGFWDMECVTDRISCHFGLFFALFYPLNNPKTQNFEKFFLKK